METKSFALGFLTALILMMCWKFISGKRSNFDSSTVFTPNMTTAQAEKALKDAQTQVQNLYNPRIESAQSSGGDAKAIKKEAIQAMSDLATAYNIWGIDYGTTAPTPSP
jgi:hypothetical protein